MRIRGQSPVLWREAGQTQVGAEPGYAVVMEGLTSQEQRLLDRLPSAIDPDAVYRTARWSRVRIERARQILDQLRQDGALADDPVSPSSADEIYWDRLSHDPGGRTTMLRQGKVAILGSGPLAERIVGYLAEAGVGTILPEDERVAAWMERAVPTVSTRAPLGCTPALAVTCDGHLVEPIRARALAQAGVVHLPVLVREVSVRVGPVLNTGEAACAFCLDLWELDADRSWPAVATQLRLLAAPVTEGLLLHQAAALAARAVTDVLTGRGDRWQGRSVELTATEPVGLERAWPRHPACLCAALAQVGSDEVEPRA